MPTTAGSPHARYPDLSEDPMYSSLDRVDLVVTMADDKERYVQTDHRDAQEIEDELPLSILFCVARVLGARRLASINNSDADVVIAMMSEPPPPDLCRAIAASGGLLEVDQQMVDLPKHTEDPFDLVDKAMRYLAADVAQSMHVQLDERGLQTVQREAWVQGLNKEADEIGYWTWVLQVAAFAGEVLRGDGQGRWVADTHNMSVLPYTFDQGGGRLLNVFGRCARLINEGPDEGPSVLLGIIADENVEEGPLLINLKHPDFGGLGKVACRTLFDMSDPDLVIPVVTYGHDRPNTFAYVFAGDDAVLDLDALHAEATQNLTRVQPTVDHSTVDGLELVVVHNDFYASEKILDTAFMSQLQLGLGAPAIMASVPRKGLMLVANAVSSYAHVFVAITLARHDDPDGAGARLSATPFMLVDGQIVGVAKVTTTQSDPPTPEKPKKHRLFGRFFGSADA
ncbi:MAG: hypothetical protein ACI9MC_000502 [Kiritimatiellia bacterium]|jgi:hypothetical protein